MTKEVVYHHSGPEPLTVGQLQAALARLPADMPMQVSMPDEPGSRYADDQYIVICAEQYIEVRDGEEVPVKVCVIEAEFPAGEYCLPEGHPQ